MNVAIDRSLENDSLVNRQAASALSYTDYEPPGSTHFQPVESDGEPDHLPLDRDSPDEDDGGATLASQFHQDAMTLAGYGVCQWLLLVVIGLALAADLAEVLSVAFLVPSAGQELCLSNSDRIWLGAVVLCGMLLGSAVWGLLGDKIGRRKALLSAIFTNALFGIIAAFIPTYSLLVVTRLISGFGAGGIVPTAVVFYAELLGCQDRGPRVSYLGMLWSLGGVFVALMAWAIIPRTGFVLMDEKQQYFCSWRIFSVLCSIPALVSAISLMVIPESPRFLLEAGREVEAVMVYKWIFKINNCNRADTQDKISELELPSRQQLLGILPRPAAARSLVTGTLKGLNKFYQSIVRICFPPSFRPTLILVTLWCAIAFSYCCLSVWLPEQLSRVESDFYSRSARYYRDTLYSDATFNSSLENVHFVRCEFRHVLFADLVFNHVHFVNATFFDCVFNNTRSSLTRFTGCDFRRTVFLDTDLGQDRFVDCRTVDCTFLSTTVGCPLDFDLNFRLATVFAQVLCTHVAVLPGTMLAALCIDKLGRARLLGFSLLAGSFCCLFLWALNTTQAIVAFEAVIQMVFSVAWSCIQVVSTELYAADVRTTAFGIHVAVSRAAGLFGCILFGYAVGPDTISPVVVTVATLFTGAVFTTQLPETKGALL